MASRRDDYVVWCFLHPNKVCLWIGELSSSVITSYNCWILVTEAESIILSSSSGELELVFPSWQLRSLFIRYHCLLLLEEVCNCPPHTQNLALWFDVTVRYFWAETLGSMAAERAHLGIDSSFRLDPRTTACEADLNPTQSDNVIQPSQAQTKSIQCQLTSRHMSVI